MYNYYCVLLKLYDALHLSIHSYTDNVCIYTSYLIEIKIIII